MRRFARSLGLAVGAALIGAAPAQGQEPEWRPPGPEMPSMPSLEELNGDWLSSRAAWFRGTEEVTGVSPAGLRASGEGRPGGSHALMVRFSGGVVPAVVWSDRNADGTADIVELLRRGGVIVQVIDADYDRRANVLRVYDGSGRLLREDRM